MRIAILESIVMPAGHEVEFDRILVEELKKQGHEPLFLVPPRYPFKLDYHIPVVYLDGGAAVSYANAGRLKKLLLALAREQRRVAWFNSAYAKSLEKQFDAIIVPTCSWRAMRSLKRSKLKNSPVPVLLQMHGIMPRDRGRFVDGVRLLRPYIKIHVAALGLQTEFPELAACPNFHTLLPPVYLPLDLPERPLFNLHKPLRLGFFGQYRREKNLEFFLQAFSQAQFFVAVELLVQGATVTETDANDFERLRRKYAEDVRIKFLHKNLLGKEWQQELLQCDVLLLPYGSERYRYQPSAMLFTAIGFNKPVLQSPEINPEVLAEFRIGEVVRLDSVEQFSAQLANFVNTFLEKAETYKAALAAANEKYSQENLVKNIVGCLK